METKSIDQFPLHISVMVESDDDVYHSVPESVRKHTVLRKKNDVSQNLSQKKHSKRTQSMHKASQTIAKPYETHQKIKN